MRNQESPLVGAVREVATRMFHSDRGINWDVIEDHYSFGSQVMLRIELNINDERVLIQIPIQGNYLYFVMEWDHKKDLIEVSLRRDFPLALAQIYMTPKEKY